jgi:hypothetical protein
MKVEKLEVGDYTHTLTKEQFKEVMKYQPKGKGTYHYTKQHADAVIYVGDFVSYIGSISESMIKKHNKLEFNEFIKRLKVTF